jgi:hypothetical protein
VPPSMIHGQDQDVEGRKDAATVLAITGTVL